MDKKNDFFFREGKKNDSGVLALIARACDAMVYISETDAPIAPVDLGPADSFDGETILQRAGLKEGTVIEEVDAERFFAKLTVIKDGQSDSQKTKAKKFLVLQEVLEKNLRSLRVYRFGKIQIDMLIVGTDATGHILGVRTNAVET